MLFYWSLILKFSITVKKKNYKQSTVLLHLHLECFSVLILEPLWRQQFDCLRVFVQLFQLVQLSTVIILQLYRVNDFSTVTESTDNSSFHVLFFQLSQVTNWIPGSSFRVHPENKPTGWCSLSLNSLSLLCPLISLWSSTTDRSLLIIKQPSFFGVGFFLLFFQVLIPWKLFLSF